MVSKKAPQLKIETEYLRELLFMGRKIKMENTHHSEYQKIITRDVKNNAGSCCRQQIGR